MVPKKFAGPGTVSESARGGLKFAPTSGIIKELQNVFISTIRHLVAFVSGEGSSVVPASRQHRGADLLFEYRSAGEAMDRSAQSRDKIGALQPLLRSKTLRKTPYESSISIGYENGYDH